MTTILFLLPSHKLGGAEIQALRLIEALDKTTFNCMAAVPKSGALHQALVTMNIPTFVSRWPHHFFKFSWIEWVVFKYRLARFLRPYSVAIIHNNSMLSLDLSIRLQHWLKIPLITHWHDNRCPDDLIPILNAHRQHPIICVSQAVQTTLKNTVPVALPLKTIYNGIDHTQYQNKPTKAIACQQLGIPEHPVYVGFLGRLTEGKGVHILIEALAQLPDAIHLIIAGTWDGDAYKTKIHHQIDAFGLGSRVHRVGFQPARTVLAASYCLALPSQTEAFPLCTLEAIAAEVPVIAHAVGGIPEQITHNQTGLLITKNIAREWASAIQYLYDNPDQHQSLATAGQHSGQPFDIQTMARSIEAVYASLAP